MKAKLVKETEKAVQLTYGCDIYGEHFQIKNVWFPKSMIDIISKNENDIIDFNPKNDWILDSKTREYCKMVAETFDHIKSEIKTYLSPINMGWKVEYCYA